MWDQNENIVSNPLSPLYKESQQILAFFHKWTTTLCYNPPPILLLLLLNPLFPKTKSKVNSEGNNKRPKFLTYLRWRTQEELKNWTRNTKRRRHSRTQKVRWGGRGCGAQHAVPHSTNWETDQAKKPKSSVSPEFLPHARKEPFRKSGEVGGGSRLQSPSKNQRWHILWTWTKPNQIFTKF